MIVEETCWERGCACYDNRFDKGVEVIRKEWVGLTDEEIRDLYAAYDATQLNYAWAIEAKLKEKNA